ncbi:MAG: pyruvate carboxylase subunit A [Candidatus Proteinoplasmatales archaeon SG8-5]|nr:MAG: pyruvate carboxylase subunit A [Candidatus Proteinoplasmatales archaeon SG8-5]
MKIDKVLVANRGEIAVRIIKACGEMSLQTVAIFSDVDEESLHVHLADEAHPLGDPTPSESYLNIDKIIGIAKDCRADAVHPGYGFLSENANFALACEDAGLKFIGPSAAVIKDMGDKIEAKRTIMKAGVPVIPGYTGEEQESLEDACQRVGFPVLIKAAAGGGGKGMKVVHTKDELADSIDSARREAMSSFGNDELLMEKYLEKPRHIEFQILADERGKVVHLFERECSIQRRHQKVIEETPSVALDEELRARMGEAAVKAAETIGYTNAGTVEFMLDKDRCFYFLEMNTRLQVEHAITEMTTGVDIVKWQLKIAAGQPLTLDQEAIKQRGHAIECRVYAEDPEKGFMPSTGKLKAMEVPNGVNIRHDTGVREGLEITPYYDPMLAKLIVHAEDRDDAIRKMHWSLSNYITLGVTTNVPFLRAMIENEAFRRGDIDTHFIDTYFQNWTMSSELPIEVLIAAALDDFGKAPVEHTNGPKVDADEHSPWKSAGAWRIDS